MTSIKEVKRRKALKNEIINGIKLGFVIYGFLGLMFLHWIIFGY